MRKLIKDPTTYYIMYNVILYIIVTSYLHLTYQIQIFTKPNIQKYMQNIPPFYWKIGNSNMFKNNKIHKLVFNDFPICIYKNNNTLEAVSDICLHRGASLSKGKLTKDCEDNKFCLECPYHGWKYREGIVCDSNDVEITKKNKKFGIPSFKIKQHNDEVFILPTYDLNSQKGNNTDFSNVHFVPESIDNSFTKISGKRTINVPNQIVTENVLDMSHISYVHTFGNRISPYPFHIEYNESDFEYGGRTTFFYTAGTSSMSKILGNVKYVRVENEFHLPDTTVTRVIFGEKMTKTVVTRCYPITENKSILFYDLYRNFLEETIYDCLFQYQMDKTLKEDIDILNNIHIKHAKGYFNTKYDITQIKYRAKLKHFTN
jgi:phenylpropionate dioxygenase-like ring-hydroxylating dioxygenase large terminal subunit